MGHFVFLFGLRRSAPLLFRSRLHQTVREGRLSLNTPAMPRRPKYLDQLPPHWRVEFKTLVGGQTAGKIDKLYILRADPDVRLRSIVEVLRYEKREKLKEKRAKFSKPVLCTHKPKEVSTKVGASTCTEGLAVLHKLITTLRKKAETLSALPAIIRRKKKGTVVFP